MQKSQSNSFVLTLPLRCEGWQQNVLDKVFRVSGTMYNLLVADRKKALAEMEHTRSWRENQAALTALYQEMDEAVPTALQKERLKQLYALRQSMLHKAGFSEYSFHTRIQKWRKGYKHLVGTHVAQKIASAVWKQFESYLYGSGKKITFKPWTENRSIEGKTNNVNIRYADGMVYVNRTAIPVVIKDDSYVAEALSRRVKYCRIIRRPWKGKHQWLYSLQLVLEGDPPVKASHETGELRHPLSDGRVGIDIGTQTIAVASNQMVCLEELAPGANRPDAELRRVNRAMDRSRRATNPEFFDSEGSIITVNKLAPALLKKNGKRRWRISRRYQRLAAQRRYLYAKLARARKCQHQAMANRLLQCGSQFYVETMSFKGLAKKAKPQEPPPGEKYKRRKRFGKSIANKAPAAMVNILEQKVLAQGGSFRRIKTWKAKASQYNHLNHQYCKKKLSQRWAVLDDGVRVQRDLYSAFLIMHSNESLDGFIQDLCDTGFAAFKLLHDAEIRRLQTIDTPGSTGIRRTA